MQFPEYFINSCLLRNSLLYLRNVQIVRWHDLILFVSALTFGLGYILLSFHQIALPYHTYTQYIAHKCKAMYMKISFKYYYSKHVLSIKLCPAFLLLPCSTWRSLHWYFPHIHTEYPSENIAIYLFLATVACHILSPLDEICVSTHCSYIFTWFEERPYGHIDSS